MDKIAASVAKVRTLKTQRMVALGNLDTKVTTFLQGISKLLTKGTRPKLKPLSSAWPESDLPNPTPNNRPTAPPTPPPDQSQSIKSIRDDSLSPLASHAPTSPSTALSPSPGSWYTQVPPLSLPPTIHEARPTDHDIIMDTLDGHRQSLGHTPNVFQSTPGCTASITSMFVFRHPNDPHQQHPNLAADPSSFWTPSQKNFDNSVWAIFSATRGLSGLYSSWYGTVPGTHGNQATNQIRNLNKKIRCPLDAVLAILARIYGPCTGQMHLFTPFFEALGIPPTSIPADLSSYTGLFSSGKPNIFDRTGRVSCDKPHLTQYIPHSYTYTPPDGVSPDGTPVWINPHQSKGPGHKGPIPGKGAGKGKGPNPGKGQLTIRRGQGLAPSRISAPPPPKQPSWLPTQPPLLHPTRSTHPPQLHLHPWLPSPPPKPPLSPLYWLQKRLSLPTMPNSRTSKVSPLASKPPYNSPRPRAEPNSLRISVTSTRLSVLSSSAPLLRTHHSITPTLQTRPPLTPNSLHPTPRRTQPLPTHRRPCLLVPSTPLCPPPHQHPKPSALPTQPPLPRLTSPLRSLPPPPPPPKPHQAPMRNVPLPQCRETHPPISSTPSHFLLH